MNFSDIQKLNQINWWKNYSKQSDWESERDKWGRQNKGSYPHIVKEKWSVLLWEGIQEVLPKYVKNKIQVHSGVRNLLSSWIACANLYFPARCHREFTKLLSGFLKSKVLIDEFKDSRVELEFSLEDELSPKELLGETNGYRGSGQTSPDVAFEVTTPKGIGLILTECKYTEKSFYRCSARRINDRGDKPGNPTPQICLQPASSCDYISIPCHQLVWGRKYLKYFELSEVGKNKLTRCPAATSGYQLVRQQALANGIYESGKYDFVVSSVAYDARNSTLINCLKTTGIKDFRNEWAHIYKRGAGFVAWHHQEWVNYVRSNCSKPIVNDWLNYMVARYGY